MRIYEPLSNPIGHIQSVMPWAYDYVFLRSVEWSNVALFPFGYQYYGFLSTRDFGVLDVEHK